MTKKRVVVLIGLSSSGKDSTLKNLLDCGDYINIISHTTRPIRTESETPNVDYYFVDELEFLTTVMIEERTYKTVHGVWRYGLSEKELFDKLKSNKTPVVILDYNGYKEFDVWCAKHNINVVPFYIETSFLKRTYRAFKRGNFNIKEWIRREIADRKSFKGVKQDMKCVKNDDLNWCIFQIKNEIRRLTLEDSNG